MGEPSARILDEEGSGIAAFVPIFLTMTPKQHEVYSLVANNFTSKEIAARLGITESAVNQRIEAVRCRAGFPPRAELARTYRAVAQRHAVHGETAASPHGLEARLSDAGTSLSPFEAGRTATAMLDGANAGLVRIAAMVLIAAGLLAVAMIALAVAQALTVVLWPYEMPGAL